MGSLESFLAHWEWPEFPDFLHVFALWDYTDEAFEVTGFFQQFFSHLPGYFLAFFALSFVFLVVPLIISMLEKIW